MNLDSDAETQATNAAECVFDLDVARTMIPGDMQSLLEIAAMMIVEFSDNMTLAHEGIAEQNAEKVTRGAHTIKGSAGLFAAERVVTASEALESIGRGGDLASAPVALASLERAVAELKDALEGLSSQDA